MYCHVANCGVLSEANTQIIAIRLQITVNEETAQDTDDFITKRLTAIKSQRNSGELEDLALVIGRRHAG